MEVLEKSTETIPEAWTQDFPFVDEASIREFAQRIGDTNPLHHDEEAARQEGLLGIIAPGVMLAGFVSAAIAEEIPGVVACRLSIDFVAPLYAGSCPTVQCTVLNQNVRMARLAFTVKNGIDVIAKGLCLLGLPKLK